VPRQELQAALLVSPTAYADSPALAPPTAPYGFHTNLLEQAMLGDYTSLLAAFNAATHAAGTSFYTLDMLYTLLGVVLCAEFQCVVPEQSQYRTVHIMFI
jgi:hypothetical protein